MKNKLSVYSKSPCFVSGLMFFSKRTLWWLGVTLVFGNLVYLCNNKSSFDQYARTVFLYQCFSRICIYKARAAVFIFY